MGTEGKCFAVNVEKEERKERTQTLAGVTSLLTSCNYSYWLLLESLLFLGDVSPAPQAFEVCGSLVTHTRVVQAASFSWSEALEVCHQRRGLPQNQAKASRTQLLQGNGGISL